MTPKPSIDKHYGKPLARWLGLVAARTGMKHMGGFVWLKSEHAMGPGHANAIAACVLAAQDRSA